METILWHQNANLNEPDIFVINGNLGQYSNNAVQNASFKILTSCRRWSEYSYENSHRNGVKAISPQLHIYYNSRSNKIMVQSHFIDMDERDRRIPFMFYQDEVTSKEEVISSICESARIAGKEVNTTDLIIIQEAISYCLKKKKSSRTALIVPISIIVISLIILCKNC